MNRDSPTKSLSNDFCYMTGSRVTRSSDPTTLILSKPNIATFKNSFCYAGAAFWNAMPISIRNAPSLGSFKTQLHKFFLDQY